MINKTKTLQALAAAVPLLVMLSSACAVDVADPNSDAVSTGTAPLLGSVGGAHQMPLVSSSVAKTASTAPPGAHLNYYGGPVISNVKIWTVFWNAAVPSQGSINAFYSAITSSAYFDWLNEYNTPTQTIGRGTLAGSLVDTGAPNGSVISDATIRTELTRLMNNGSLPNNDGNTLYMVYFPAGVTITEGGHSSCAGANAFCAYHNTYVRGGVDAYYGVVPDLSGGCATGCGGSSSKWQNTTTVSSHEMIEAVTDSAVGLVTSISAPMAWYDTNWGEIGDICNGQQATVAGFAVQKEYSNLYKDCVSHSCCPIGFYDGANCQLGRAPAGSSGFIYNGQLYYTAVVTGTCSEAGSWWDGLHCHLPNIPGGTTPFIWNGNAYYTYAAGGNRCPVPDSWDDGMHCEFGVPAGSQPFLYQGELFYNATVLSNSCPLAGSWWDGAHCEMPNVPAGATPFVWQNVNLDYSPVCN